MWLGLVGTETLERASSFGIHKVFLFFVVFTNVNSDHPNIHFTFPVKRTSTGRLLKSYADTHGMDSRVADGVIVGGLTTI